MLLSQRVLGVQARYRVVGVRDGLVELVVVSAPGLAPGARVRVTGAAAAAMRGWDPNATGRPGRGRAVVLRTAARDAGRRIVRAACAGAARAVGPIARP